MGYAKVSKSRNGLEECFFLDEFEVAQTSLFTGETAEVEPRHERE